MTPRVPACLAALAALLAGCNAVPDKPNPAPTHKARPRAVASPAPRSPAERLADALRVVPPGDGRYTFGKDDKLLDTPFGPVLLRHGHAPDAGHPEGGVIAAYYLREQQGRFELARAYPEAAMSGSFGDLAKWSVSDKFATLPVLVVEGGGTWQGCTVSDTDLIELRPTGPASLASITTIFDDSGMEQDNPQSLTGSLTDIVRDRSFTVRYQGTRSFAERYVRRGDRFVLEGGESQIPGC
ncbi:hypothetical protein [Sphingomonas psychrotolerans]|uniref:Lipoprotein n=1 Tax=Sphingomonas psychrotolerans TaxID=1327635 RepID=A0A2K8MHP1_9SPHN|nr:hypothetical protein [Sphingomonas psychrotolerans]ATY33400.1 hypothetical protein CVN68_16695 [Sphingomonas psychrotolerans]